jgi:GNAT superfamily N-acetyltransferase
LWLRPAGAGFSADTVPALALEAAGGEAVVAVDDLDWSASLADARLPLVRHAHGLVADPSVVVASPVRSDVRFGPLDAASLEQLAELWVAAYPPGHPDHSGETVTDRVAAYSRELTDPDNPVLAASRTAWLGSELVGACLVVDARHFPGLVGPWVQNVVRRPVASARGVGAALLVEAARRVLADGGDHVGLAVTDSNPARALYERMGWSGTEMWLHRVPGEQG